MALSEDLINFDLIETHKENIQTLAGGRSARQLASILSPLSLGRSSTTPTLDETKTLNDAIRQEYEIELQTAADSDDPLDIFDRYVKWTLNAYPSAQATPQSQLLPLLERATKTFLTSSHYKNDPRYLKLWLHYIRLFSDAPRETFAFLARHNIGEGLGLFYEEFAAWLETAGRWGQADEVYKLGIEKEARPAERLMRKYNQFQKRFELRPINANEPSSPALPTVRPALAAKMDPFAATPRLEDRQPQPQRSVGAPATSSRSGKPKMAIFSDAENPTPPPLATNPSKGWDSIGSIRDRKKENTVEARPWAGETLQAGKKVGNAPKMEIFKDPNQRENESKSTQNSKRSTDVVNPRTGRVERVFVNIEAIYPNEIDEFSFEELRSMKRGWASQKWHQKPSSSTITAPRNNSSSPSPPDSSGSVTIEKLSQDFEQKASIDIEKTSSPAENQEQKPPKQKRIKVREIKQETQTVKTRLESPAGRKLKRKNSAEPTMTFHSKAATDEIYSIFNKPTRSDLKDDTQSGDDTDYGDDGYSTGGESTGTGRISGATSEYGDEDTIASIRGDHNSSSQIDSASPWSDFTASKHVPKMKNRSRQQTNDDLTEAIDSSQNQTQTGGFDTQAIAAIANQDFGEFDTRVIAAMAGDHENEDETEQFEEDLKTPVDEPELPIQMEVSHKPRYVPLPPEDYEPTPLRPYRDHCANAQHRLPFMTPIVEKTESSLAPSTAYSNNDYFVSKTPSKSSFLRETQFESPSQIKVNNLILSSPQKQSPSSTKRKLQQSSADAYEHELEFLSSSPQKKKDSRSPVNQLRKVEFPSSSPQKKKSSQSPVKQLNKVEFPVAKSVFADEAAIFTIPSQNGTRARSPLVTDLQCNPVSDSIRSQILACIHPPMSSEPGYFDHSNTKYAHYTQLSTFAAKSANQRPSKASPRKNQNEKTVTKAMGPMLKFENTSRVYAVKKLLGKGAFAPVYLVDSYDPESAEDAKKEQDDAPSQSSGIHNYLTSRPRGALEAIKTDSPPLNAAWEFHILRLLVHRLGPSARAMTSLVHAPECHIFADEAYLVLDYHRQGTLLDLVNAVQADNKRAGKAGSDGLEESLAMWVGIELLGTVEELNRVGILHGDLKPDNCLVRFDVSQDLQSSYRADGSAGWSSRGLVLIDFGRGIDTCAFDPRARFVADWASDKADCPEIRECRSWKAEIDWFGAAAVLHSALFGKYIDTVEMKPVASPSDLQVDEEAAGMAMGLGVGIGMGLGLGKKKTYKLREPFRRYWQSPIWNEVFHTLINSGVVEAAGAGAGTSAGTAAAAAGGDEAKVRKEVGKCRVMMEEWLEAESERGGRDLRTAIRRAERLIGATAA